MTTQLAERWTAPAAPQDAPTLDLGQRTTAAVALTRLGQGRGSSIDGPAAAALVRAVGGRSRPGDQVLLQAARVTRSPMVPNRLRRRELRRLQRANQDVAPLLRELGVTGPNPPSRVPEAIHELATVLGR